VTLKTRQWFVPDVLLTLDELGQGGMGTVFVGYHKPKKTLVAIKTLFPEYAQDEMYIARFRREVAVYQKLNHPNIVHYVDSGCQDGTYYIALEFIHGTGLDTVIQHKTSFPADESLDLFEPLVDAVGHAHENGVIHRDLKPQNVVISEYGVVKLLDFGIAQQDDEIIKTMAGSVLGTFFYAAPEQNQGKKIDNRSDIYALGLILYELVTGKRALAGNDLMQVTLVQMKGSIPRPSTVKPGIPPGVEKLIMKCIERDPANRYASCKDILADIQSIRNESSGDGARAPSKQDHTVLFTQAKEAMLKRNHDMALKICLEIMEIRKDLPEVHNILGKVYTEKGSPQLAIEHFKESIRLAPKDKQLPVDFAVSLFKLRLLDQAKAEFLKIQEKQPDNVYAKTYLTQIRNAEDRINRSDATPTRKS
jgi:serine/threonine protein kinase